MKNTLLKLLFRKEYDELNRLRIVEHSVNKLTKAFVGIGEIHDILRSVTSVAKKGYSVDADYAYNSYCKRLVEGYSVERENGKQFGTVFFMPVTNSVKKTQKHWSRVGSHSSNTITNGDIEITVKVVHNLTLDNIDFTSKLIKLLNLAYAPNLRLLK